MSDVMGDLAAAFSKMSGISNNDSKEIVIDIREALIKSDALTTHLVRDKYEEAIDKLCADWPELADSRNYFIGNWSSNIGQLIADEIGSNPSIADNVKSIVIHCYDKTVYISVVNGGNVADIVEEMYIEYGVSHVEYCKSSVSVIKSEVNKSEERWAICVYYDGGIKEGKTIPSGLKLETPIELHDNTLYSGIRVKKSSCKIVSHGVNCIKDEVPIVANGVNVLKIEGSGTLELVATGSMQPCIGVKNATGLSYGRWTSEGEPPKCIIIDGVCVRCTGTVDNFTLGMYGSNFIPEVVLVNGGTLECPEMTGDRVMEDNSSRATGSSKSYGSVIYSIV